MRHHHHQPARGPAVAFATACENCASLIGNPEPGEENIRMTVVHIGCISELEAEGWITTPGQDGIPDCCCPHYHAANWTGGHGDDCCGGSGP